MDGSKDMFKVNIRDTNRFGHLLQFNNKRHQNYVIGAFIFLIGNFEQVWYVILVSSLLSLNMFSPAGEIKKLKQSGYKVEFNNVIDVVLVPLLLTLNMFHTFFWRLYYQLWTGKRLLGIW